MPSPVTPQFLLEGAVYALEQCGLLLRDANILYRNGSYASAVVLTAFAREELGRFIILLDFRAQVVAGRELTLKEIEDRCQDHETKQRAGMLSSAMTGGGRIRELILLSSSTQGAEWQAAHDELEQLRARQDRRTPGARHTRRVSALYVEPSSPHQWNRPATTPAAVAHDFLQHAVSDYAGRYHQGYLTPQGAELLPLINPELHAALEQWSDRPELWPPEWPAAEHW